jgi:hypothetical protein
MQNICLTKSHIVGDLGNPDPPHEYEIANIREGVLIL